MMSKLETSFEVSMFYLFKQRKCQILFFLILILISSAISSCSPNLPKEEDISNQSSPLLKIIDCDRGKQAENGWSWYSLHVIQETLSPSLENSYASERAICSSLGQYSPNWIANYGAILTYTITKYDKPVSLTQDSVKMEDFTSGSSFSPKLVQVGKKMYVNCLTENGKFNMFSCLLKVQYNHAVLLVRLSGDPGIDIKNIENFINTILTRLDTSIQTID